MGLMIYISFFSLVALLITFSSHISIGLREKKKRQIFIEGHRGFGLLEPENTLRSYNRSIMEGLDSIELDVWLTKDQQIIVYHGDEYGNPFIKIDDQTFDLTELDADYIRENYFPYGKQNRIPLLKEVLELCKSKIKINIELKSNSKQIYLIDAVIQLVKNYKIIDQILLSSFDHNYYYRMLELLKTKKLETIIPFNFLIHQKNLFKLIDYQHMLNPSINGITFASQEIDNPQLQDIIINSRHNNLTINIYFQLKTEETIPVYQYLYEKGITTFIVNQPLLALQYKNSLK